MCLWGLSLDISQQDFIKRWRVENGNGVHFLRLRCIQALFLGMFNFFWNYKAKLLQLSTNNFLIESDWWTLQFLIWFAALDSFSTFLFGINIQVELFRLLRWFHCYVCGLAFHFLWFIWGITLDIESNHTNILYEQIWFRDKCLHSSGIWIWY